MNNKSSHTPGEKLFIGMGICNGHTVVMSVGYFEDYAFKKAMQFEEASKGLVILDSINEVEVGNLEKTSKISRIEAFALYNKDKEFSTL